MQYFFYINAFFCLFFLNRKTGKKLKKKKKTDNQLKHNDPHRTISCALFFQSHYILRFFHLITNSTLDLDSDVKLASCKPDSVKKKQHQKVRSFLRRRVSTVPRTSRTNFGVKYSRNRKDRPLTVGNLKTDASRTTSRGLE